LQCVLVIREEYNIPMPKRFDERFSDQHSRVLASVKKDRMDAVAKHQVSWEESQPLNITIDFDDYEGLLSEASEPPAEMEPDDTKPMYLGPRVMKLLAISRSTYKRGVKAWKDGVRDDTAIPTEKAVGTKKKGNRHPAHLIDAMVEARKK